MKRIRLSTLMLLILIVALVCALMVQNRRYNRLEARLKRETLAEKQAQEAIRRDIQDAVLLARAAESHRFNQNARSELLHLKWMTPAPPKTAPAVKGQDANKVNGPR